MGLTMELLESLAGRVGAVLKGMDRQQPKIAVIGTEGSGKTVFIAALAHRLGETEAGWLLDPLDMKTEAYVAKVWDTLCRGDWPSFTSQAALHDLRWNLHNSQGASAELQLVDASGHRLRELFTGDLSEIPEHLRPLAEYCQEADLVILLVNLQDFLGEAAGEQRAYNEMALKFALDFVGARRGQKHCCAVFTQIDLYCGLLEQHGTWNGVAAALVPKLSSAYFHNGNIPIFGLAAVDGTEIRSDERGMPRRFPAPGFSSTGFQPLVDWFKSALNARDVEFARRDLWYRLRNALLPLGAVALCLTAWFWIVSPMWTLIAGWLEPPPPRIEVLERPVTWSLLGERFFFRNLVPTWERTYRAELSITFRNDGGDGMAVFLAHFKGGGLDQRKASEPFEVKRGRTYMKKVSFEPVVGSEFESEIATTDVEIVR